MDHSPSHCRRGFLALWTSLGIDTPQRSRSTAQYYLLPDLPPRADFNASLTDSLNTSAVHVRTYMTKTPLLLKRNAQLIEVTPLKFPYNVFIYYNEMLDFLHNGVPAASMKSCQNKHKNVILVNFLFCSCYTETVSKS